MTIRKITRRIKSPMVRCSGCRGAHLPVEGWDREWRQVCQPCVRSWTEALLQKYSRQGPGWSRRKMAIVRLIRGEA